MLNDSLPQLVKPTLIALNDVHHKLHHVVLDGLILVLHGVDFLHTTLDLPHDKFARVSIDQDDPLVNEELLRLELDLDGLEHLNSLNDHLEGSLGHRRIILLK